MAVYISVTTQNCFTNMIRITKNSIKCVKCGEVISSTHRHDYNTCRCGNCFVDGGNAYLRRGGEYEELSEVTLSTVEMGMLSAAIKELQKQHKLIIELTEDYLCSRYEEEYHSLIEAQESLETTLKVIDGF